MRARFFSFFLTLLLSFSLLEATAPPLLTSSDVRKVMDELFEYHIDKKEISPVILERSLKIYITQFDPRRAYLLKSEVAMYMPPSQGSLQGMMKEYNADNFNTYFAINGKIQKSITRARLWRSEWEKDPKVLIAEAKEISLQQNRDEERPFASDEQELKKRHSEELLKLVRIHIEDVGAAKLEGKEERLIKLCEKQLSLSENDYLGVDEEGRTFDAKKKEHTVVLRTLKALAHSLDAHTAYYSPEEAYGMKVQLEKGMCGIGVVLHEGIDGVVIADLLKGGPAAQSGNIQSGDCITEVDGVSIKDFSFHKVLEVLRGENGSTAVLGIVRDKENNKEFFRVELTRSHITLDDKRVDISYEPYGDGIIGKITLYSFYEGEDGVTSEKDLRKAIDYLKAQGPLYGLVLDMRDNGGGFLSQAVRVGGLFISGGVVVISKYSDGSIKYYRAVEGKRYYDGPLVVLISKGSASATEIVAQSLQDYGVGVIVGDSQTYGKGTIQHQTVTSDSTQSFFKVTIGRYYTVSGKSTQIDGVKADIVVPTALNFEKMGEGYLEFPLASDQVAPAYVDTLSDLDPYAKKWFSKYYISTVQPRVEYNQQLVPLLKENSQKRLAQNKNYQAFLKKAKKEEEKAEYGSNDLQMEESINIVRDMIFLQNTVKN
jgi:carboxyl-terminal processing protease